MVRHFLLHGGMPTCKVSGRRQRGKGLEVPCLYTCPRCASIPIFFNQKCMCLISSTKDRKKGCAYDPGCTSKPDSTVCKVHFDLSGLSRSRSLNHSETWHHQRIIIKAAHERKQQNSEKIKQHKKLLKPSLPVESWCCGELLHQQKKEPSCKHSRSVESCCASREKSHCSAVWRV